LLSGGIDIHSHIAGEPLPLLRDVGNPLIPTVTRLGEAYSRMGYTLAVNAAMPALSARHTIVEENAVPKLDTLNLTWVGENPVLLKLAERGSNGDLDEYLSWLLAVSGGWGLKLINPREGQEDGDLPYRKLIDRLVGAVRRLKLPHALHLHHPFLGRPNACEAVKETVKRAEGNRLHLAHLQFYGYRQNGDGHMVSTAEALMNMLNDHKNVTCDVGAVVFGAAVGVTADTEFAKKLGKGKQGFQSALWETDGGFSVLPLKYNADNAVGATQFLTGLEMLLLADDPSRIFLTTDHPNGGPFTAYPYLIRLLMDADFRSDELKKLNPGALSRSAVPGLRREYSIYEIAQITRSGPAMALGLSNRGHIGVGAIGGVAVYRDQTEKGSVFGSPAAVFRTQTHVLAAAERPYDKMRIERLVQDIVSMPVADTHPGAQFFCEHRVLREEA
jgi:formylmethanofuran dehydrogenase subunit A